MVLLGVAACATPRPPPWVNPKINDPEQLSFDYNRCRKMADRDVANDLGYMERGPDDPLARHNQAATGDRQRVSAMIGRHVTECMSSLGYVPLR